VFGKKWIDFDLFIKPFELIAGSTAAAGFLLKLH
jgi:hypothetical protein